MLRKIVKKIHDWIYPAKYGYYMKTSGSNSTVMPLVTNAGVKAKFNIKEAKPMKAKFELFRGADEQWYFNLKANNGKVICQSEGYRRRASALKGIAAIKKVAVKAKIVETD